MISELLGGTRPGDVAATAKASGSCSESRWVSFPSAHMGVGFECLLAVWKSGPLGGGRGSSWHMFTAQVAPERQSFPRREWTGDLDHKDHCVYNNHKGSQKLGLCHLVQVD